MSDFHTPKFRIYIWGFFLQYLLASNGSIDLLPRDFQSKVFTDRHVRCDLNIDNVFDISVKLRRLTIITFRGTDCCSEAMCRSVTATMLERLLKHRRYTN